MIIQIDIKLTSVQCYGYSTAHVQWVLIGIPVLKFYCIMRLNYMWASRKLFSIYYGHETQLWLASRSVEIKVVALNSLLIVG
jgi:hypothetical protein